MPILVVGGGEAAAQKVRLLRKSSALIRIVAPTLNDELSALVRNGDVDWINSTFTPKHLAQCRLVFATTGNRFKDAGVAFAARSRSIPVNVVDMPQFCTFITPAIVDRDPVLVAIGTEGAAPVLAQKIKGMLEAWLPSQLGVLTSLARRLRPELADRQLNNKGRRHFWKRFFDGDIARRFYAGDKIGAEFMARKMLVEPPCFMGKQGHVALVGAGPGDPDLLTFKAARALQQADVIVVDRLVNPAILEIARRDARRIDVGKVPGQHKFTQEEISQILVDEARQGNYVVRLKGGDPMVFGRAAEEIAALQAHDVEFDIIPGISAVLAASASARALLTERDCRRSLTMITGHASDGQAEHDWKALAQSGQTIAIYMGVGAALRIQRRLIEAGIAPSTTIILVENASLPNEIIASGRVGALAELIHTHGVKGPAIILVGARQAISVSTELMKVA